eukprot:sb/3475563/
MAGWTFSLFLPEYAAKQTIIIKVAHSVCNVEVQLKCSTQFKRSYLQIKQGSYQIQTLTHVSMLLHIIRTAHSSRSKEGASKNLGTGRVGSSDDKGKIVYDKYVGPHFGNEVTPCQRARRSPGDLS